MTYTEEQVSNVLAEIKQTINRSLYKMNPVSDSIDEQMTEIMHLSELSRNIKFLLSSPWRCLEMELLYLKNLLESGDESVTRQITLIEKEIENKPEIQDKAKKSLEEYLAFAEKKRSERTG